MRPNHQHPALPLLPDEILGEAVRQHRTGRRNVDHVGPAILFAQSIIDRAGIEQCGSPVPEGVGNLQQRVRRQIGNDKTDVSVGERDRRLGCVIAFLESNFFQTEMLIQELAGGVIVLDREPGASHAVVLGGLLDQGQRRLDGGAPEIADLDLDRIGRKRGGDQHGQAEDYPDEQSDHLPSLMPRSTDQR